MAKTKFDSEWTFENALAFIRALEFVVCDVGYHVALLGSVLHRGYSEQDVDIAIYPHTTSKQDRRELCKAMTKFGLERGVPFRDVVRVREIEHPDTKHIEVWRYKGRRVDIFFLS